MREYDFSLDACYESVTFDIEFLHRNIFEEYGKALVRSKQDICFNKTMIKAYEKYIEATEKLKQAQRIAGGLLEAYSAFLKAEGLE